MRKVKFKCPYCDNELHGTSDMDGETHKCPECNGHVTLRVDNSAAKRAVGTAVAAGLIGLLGAFFDN